MIDHINIPVRNIHESKDFYSNALAPLGYGVLMENETHCGIGPISGKEKWIGTCWLVQSHRVTALHIAFRVPHRSIVDLFYEAALASGAVCNGKPGIRKEYHTNYYAAFILDRDGHNIEVVCHDEDLLHDT